MSEEQRDTAVEPGETAQPASINDLERKMKLRGTVERLELYGAFIDVGVGTSALVHISKLGDGHVNRVSDVLNVGDEVEAAWKLYTPLLERPRAPLPYPAGTWGPPEADALASNTESNR